MHDVAEAFEPGAGIRIVCNGGPGGEAVPLVASAEPGVELVLVRSHRRSGGDRNQIVEGLMPRCAVRAAMAVTDRSRDVEATASDMEELSEEDHRTLRRQ